MFRNYLTAAIRNLRKNKGFSILNIAGLSVGIACAALILLWVRTRWAMTIQTTDHDHIARVMETETRAGANPGPYSAAPGPLGPAIRAEITGVKNLGADSQERYQGLRRPSGSEIRSLPGKGISENRL